MWSWAAGDPNPARVVDRLHIERTEHAAGDGRILRGYRYRAISPSGATGAARGYVLVAGGNAMLADQIIAEMEFLARAGLDVYVYDYRGYGESEGKRRLKAIVEDYKEITGALNTQYERGLLYGISFGGIVLLNVIGAGIDFTAAVIDSSPSRVSDYGCPEQFDPVENLPVDGSRLLVIRGAADRVVTPAMSEELGAVAQRNGGCHHFDERFDHPFMDHSIRDHERRLRMVRDFLVDAPGCPRR